MDSGAANGDSHTATTATATAVNPNTNSNSSSSSSSSSSGVGALPTVAVSLSGGVDSMALCRALVHLKPRYGFEVVGIHIDYGNRHESGREADYVEGWCARHGVVFFKRAIAEVSAQTSSEGAGGSRDSRAGGTHSWLCFPAFGGWRSGEYTVAMVVDRAFCSLGVISLSQRRCDL